MADLTKPSFGQACNGCGYCCTREPCRLAQEFLHCSVGPCVALEAHDGRTVCGLVRNPLGYLFRAAHPEADVSILEGPDTPAGYQLSTQFAAALGLGQGCDASDDEQSKDWKLLSDAR
jgi:hypothetical protein